MKSTKIDLPLLTRTTQWSPERLAKLSVAELKQLRANAERLGEAEVAALCTAAIRDRPRPVAAKPAVKKAPAAKIPAPAAD